MYEVTVNMESLPKGADVEIDGLGIFKNGETADVTDEAAEQFRIKHTSVAYEYDDKGNMSQEVTQGPTVLQAFKDSETVSVVVKKDNKPNNKQEGGSDNA